jgi:hypothetical protein
MKKEFEIIQDKYPAYSSLICFTKLIRGKKYPWSLVRKWFNKLVDKDDYDKEVKKEVLGYLGRVNQEK